MANDDTEKEFDPTPNKILEARKKGDVVKSQDLNTAAGYLGFLIALTLVGAGPLFDIANTLSGIVRTSPGLADQIFSGSAAPHIAEIAYQISGFLLVIFGIPAFCVLLSVLAQQSLVFAPTKIAPKLNRISPLNGVKQKFGMTGIFEWFKSLTKLVVISTVLTVFLSSQSDSILSTSALNSATSLSFLGNLILKFTGILLAIATIIGVIDYLFQYFEHRRKLRMSRKEITEETKESEGDPHMKQARRQRAQDRAMSQSFQDVKNAEVIITNPTHYAVALAWDRKKGTAPTCVCKGQDSIALAIRQEGIDHNVPIFQDPPTARSLFATTEVGNEINPEIYQAVAAAIRFSDVMRTKSKARGV